MPLSFPTAIRNADSDLLVYEQLFRSPVISTCDLIPVVSPVEPTPLTLNDSGSHTLRMAPQHKSLRQRDVITFRSDTDAALLLTSIKKLDVKQEPLRSKTEMSHVSKLGCCPNSGNQCDDDEFKPIPSTFSKLCTVMHHKSTVGNREGTERTVLNSAPTSRVRAVSVDLHHLSDLRITNGCIESSHMIPKERISLDLTTNLNDTSSTSPNKVSPPNSPVLVSIRSISDIKKDQEGPRRLGLKKRSAEVIKSASRITEPMKKRKKQPKARPSILRPKEGITTKDVDLDKKVLRKKFSWKNYPELEDFLIANREEYLRHSAMNYTSQQKEYNNRLTERLLELATDCGYVFDEESFSFVSIRDRIRCYFKSYVQSKKKRGLILGYAARRKGLITEEELEKSAQQKGTIVMPKTSSVKKVRLS